MWCDGVVDVMWWCSSCDVCMYGLQVLSAVMEINSCPAKVPPTIILTIIITIIILMIIILMLMINIIISITIIIILTIIITIVYSGEHLEVGQLCMHLPGAGLDSRYTRYGTLPIHLPTYPYLSISPHCNTLVFNIIVWSTSSSSSPSPDIITIARHHHHHHSITVITIITMQTFINITITIITMQTSSLYLVWSGTSIYTGINSTLPTTVRWCGTTCTCSGSYGHTACSHCAPSIRPSTDRDVSITISLGCSTTSTTRCISGRYLTTLLR